MRLKELRKAKGITGAQLAKDSVSLREVSLDGKKGLGNASFKFVVNILQLSSIEIDKLK